MNFKASLIIILILIFGSLTYGIIYGNLEGTIFNDIPYNYTSHVWIPPDQKNNGSLGGFYTIYGQGKNFNFNIVLPGAENEESPLDYTKNGLNGTGKINDINITFNTLKALLSGDLKGTMFNTAFDGVFNMECAAWTGYGNFSNDGQNFTGNFTINGPITYWEGTFNLKPDNNRMRLEMDYIFYPNNNPKNVKKAQDIIYM